jgi:hypothetical protein
LRAVYRTISLNFRVLLRNPAGLAQENVLRNSAKVKYSAYMLHDIREAAGRIGLSEGTLLLLARETAQDARLLSVEALNARDRDQLLTLLQWISYDQAHLLVTRRHPLAVRIPLIAA